MKPMFILIRKQIPLDTNYMRGHRNRYDVVFFVIVIVIYRN